MTFHLFIIAGFFDPCAIVSGIAEGILPNVSQATIDLHTCIFVGLPVVHWLNHIQGLGFEATTDRLWLASRDTAGSILSFKTREAFDTGMTRLSEMNMINIDDETKVVTHGAAATTKLATSAFQELNTIRFFQFFTQENILRTLDIDSLPWYLELAAENFIENEIAVLFARYFIIMMKSTKYLFTRRTYDIPVMNNILGDTPYLHYQDETHST